MNTSYRQLKLAMPDNSKPIYKRAGRKFLEVLGDNQATHRLLLRLSRKGALPPAVWQRIAPPPEFRVTLFGNELSYVSAPNDVIGNELYWTGSFEKETSDIFARLARTSKIVLDVGANTGFFTLLACRASQDVHLIAFEPIPQIFELLERNVRSNHWEDRCTLYQAAVSEHSGVAQFHVPATDAIPTSGSLNPDGFRGALGELIQTPLVTLDEVCQPLDTVDLVKIDVEGFEDQVLLGMKATLERLRPNLIVECNFDGPFAQVERILAPYGYHFFALHARQIVQLDHIVPDPEGKARNILCSIDAKIAARLTVR